MEPEPIQRSLFKKPKPKQEPAQPKPIIVGKPVYVSGSSRKVLDLVMREFFQATFTPPWQLDEPNVEGGSVSVFLAGFNGKGLYEVRTKTTHLQNVSSYLALISGEWQPDQDINKLLRNYLENTGFKTSDTMPEKPKASTVKASTPEEKSLTVAVITPDPEPIPNEPMNEFLGDIKGIKSELTEIKKLLSRPMEQTQIEIVTPISEPITEVLPAPRRKKLLEEKPNFDLVLKAFDLRESQRAKGEKIFKYKALETVGYPEVEKLTDDQVEALFKRAAILRKNGF